MTVALPEWPEVPVAQKPSGHYTLNIDASALGVIEGARTMIAGVIAFWSQAEANLRVLLLSSFGPDIDATSKLIEKAQSDDFVRVLLPVATSSLRRPDMTKAVTQFLKQRLIAKRHRDTFAHAVYASRSDLPGVLLISRTDPFVTAHLQVFHATRSGKVDSVTDVPQFSVWTPESLARVHRLERAYLDSSHALSVCFARDPAEVGRWRTELEDRGLSPNPPWM